MNTAIDRLAAYRSDHRIFLVDEQHPDFGHIFRCGTDGIRVHPTRNGRWYHDASELKKLLDANYGGPESWGRERAIDRILETVPDRDEDDDQDDWSNREGAPEFNGSFR